MALYGFGSGVMWGTPLQDNNGATIANPTPVLLGVLQDVSIDFGFDLKELYGTNQFPVAIGRGKGKITGKAKWAQLNGAAINSLVFGQTLANGLLSAVFDQTGATIPGTPFTITPASGGNTWVADLGVRDSSGNPMTRKASAPAAGEYSVAAGVYTFAAADTGKTVYISYQYTATSTVARNSTVANTPMGTAPSWRCDFFTSLNAQPIMLSLLNCYSSKLAISTKMDDFLVPEIDFSASADAAGNIMKWGMAQ
jgi:hypothetical protein